MRNKDKGGWWGLAVFAAGMLIMGIHKVISEMLEDDE
jgi:hypothetical protein